MQSLKTLARVAEVDRELFEARAHEMLKLCSNGELTALMDFFAEDVAYQLIGNWNLFPFAKPVRGKAAAAQALRAIFTHLQSLGSEVHDILIDGDRMAVRRTTRLRHLGTGRIDDIAIVDFVRFRDGLVTEIIEIVDSLAAARLEEG